MVAEAVAVVLDGCALLCGLAELDVWDTASELGRESKSEDTVDIEIDGVDEPVAGSVPERTGELLFGDPSTELDGDVGRLDRYDWSSNQV